MPGDDLDPQAYHPTARVWLDRLWRGLAGPGPAPTYVLTRFLILRVLGLVCLAAFLSAVFQLVPLVGARGLTPAADELAALADAGVGFWQLPTLFWWDRADPALLAVSLVGAALSALLLLGLENAALLLVLWALYLSIVQVGGLWYGFGWEILLLETLVLAALLCPLTRLRPLAGDRPPPFVAIVLLRWLALRVMLGAGLIKLRGDACWTDLTCLDAHFETQPLPNPLSLYLHHLPRPLLHAGVVANHIAELVLPWFVFGPRRLRIVAGLGMIGFQVALILSGNLSFLNWLTIVPLLACLDDTFLRRCFPRRVASPTPAPATRPARVVAGLFAALVAWRSLDVVANLLGRRQAMNASFDRLHLVNTYGAFGSVHTDRHELEIQGTDDPDPEHADWRPYVFRCKPGPVDRRPCVVAPYHLRLDWLMWFAALDVQAHGGLTRDTWLLDLLDHLLAADPQTLGLLESAPAFAGGAPTHVRVEVYRYRFAAPGEPVWWHREHLGPLVRPVRRDDPALRAALGDD